MGGGKWTSFKKAIVAAALVMAHALIAAPAHAQHTSAECPAQTATVAAGGTVTINITDCATSSAFFSIGPVDGGSTPVGAPFDFPDHGAANLRISNGQWFVDYSHNGSTGIGGSDVFEFTEGTGTGNGDVRVTITIQPAASVLTVAPGTLPTLTAGMAFSQTLSTTGGTGPYSYSLQSGTLPPGVSLSTSGVLSGSPTQRGGYSFGVRVTDSTSPTPNSVEKGYTGNIQQPTLSLAQSSYSIVQGVPASFTIGVNGGVAPYSFLVEPVTPNALPAGLSLSSTGQITGTPTASGTFTTTIRVGDSSTGPGQYFELETLTINVTAPPTVSIAVSPASVAEDGSTNLTYTVTRSVASASPLTVNLATSGTATSGSDYTGAASTIVIPANAASATLTINPTADTVSEANETVIVSIASGSGYTVGTPSSATGTINNDEGTSAFCPTLLATVTWGGTVSINAGSCNAGFGLGVVLSQPTHGTASVGAFGPSQPIIYTHNGASGTTDTFTVNDGEAPPNNQIRVNITILPATSSLVVAPVNLSAMVAGTPFTQTLSTTGGTAPYTYALDSGTLPVGLTLSNGGVISGTPTQRGSYAFNVRVTDSSNPTAQSVVKGYSGSVQNPALALAQSSYSIVQGAPASFTIGVNGGVAPYSFLVEPVPPNALPAGLSLSSTGQITGTPTASGTFNTTIRVTDASTGSGSYFELETLTINVASPPAVSISVSPATVSEDGATNLTYIVARSVALSTPTVVNLTTAGTATSGTDYTGGVTSVTIPANAAQATVVIDPTVDSAVEPDETVTLTVAAGTGYTVGASASATGTIVNDDNQLATITVSPASVAEDGAANLVYTVNLTGPAATPTSVNFTVTGTATSGTDYAAVTSPLVIPAGSSSGTITIDPTADGTIEPDETVVITLTAGTGYTLGAPASATGTIQADEVLTLSIAPAALNAMTAGDAFTQTLTASGGTGPYTFSIDSGALPTGLTLAADGTISGIPTRRGAYSVTVRVEDSLGAIGARTFSDTVLSAPLVTSPTTFSFAQGVPVSTTLTTTGGVPPYRNYQVISGTLPAGLTLSTDGTISGTPTAVGSSTVTARVSDSSTPGTRFSNFTLTINIVNLPTVSVAVSPASTAEDGATNLVYTVTRDLVTASPLTVSLATSGTASSGSDYSGAVATVTIPANAASATVTINPVADAVIEPNETVILTIASDAAYLIGSPSSATGTITNDDFPTASLALAPASAAEDGPTNMTVTVTLDAPAPAATSVNFTLGGTAINGADYAPLNSPLVIPAGASSGTLVINPNTDGLMESDETVVVALAAGSGYQIGSPASVTATILNDDFPSISINGATVAEGNSGTTDATFTISLSSPALAGGVTFDIATADGTATAGTDYTAQSVTGLTIPAGSTTATFTVAVIGDLLDELSETFFVNLTNVTNATLAGVQGLGTIVDDDLPPTITINDVSVVEGNSGTTSAVFTVSMSAPSAQIVTASFVSANGTATTPADYVAASGVVTFAPGETTQTISVPVVGDILPEADETFQVTLTNATNGLIIDRDGLGTIVNDDVPVTVLPSTLPGATVGVSYNSTISATGGASPYSFAVTGGTLPTGLNLAPSGQLSGIPTAGGTFNFTITATDSSAAPGPFSESRTYAIVVASPTITLPATSLPGGQNGITYSAALTAATGGTAPFTYNVTGGALPTGLSLSTSGTITGTPSVFGTFAFTVTATDSSTGTGPYSASQSYTIEILPATPVAGAVSVNLPYGAPQTAVALNLSGGAPTSVSVVTAPSNGVATVDGIGISYRPNSSFSGTDSFTYTATNSGGTSQPATVTVTVAAPTLSVSATGPLTATVGQSYSQTFSFAGGSAPFGSYQVNGLPAGVALTGTNSNSVTIAGIPRAQGTFAVSVSAIDSSTGNGPFTASEVFNLSVGAPNLALDPASGSFEAPYAAPFNRSFTASGGIGPYSYAISGSLPNGMTFDTASGTISGSPIQTGAYPFTITATDTGATGAGAPFTIAGSYTINVAAPTIVVTPATLPNATSGTAYSVRLAASGAVAPYSFSLTGGALPAGLTLSAEGDLSGTPTASGSFGFTVTARDANGQSSPTNLTLVVDIPVLTIRPETLPAASQGLAYSQRLSATGGVAPYRYAVTTGTLPAGLALDPVTGVISGTPTGSGTVNFAITVTDSTTGTAATGTISYALQITARPDPALDPEVRGLVQAQAQSSRRLANSQVNNFMRRLESMRGMRRSGGGFQNGVRLSGPSYCEDSITNWTNEACRKNDQNQPGIAAADRASEPVEGASNSFAGEGEKAWTVWTGGTIRFGDRDAQSGRLSQEFNSEGISLGADYQFSPSFAAGLGVGIGRDETEVGENGSRSEGTAKTIAAYGSHQLGKGIYLEWLGGYQWLDFDLRRYVTSTGALIDSNRSGQQWFATGSVGAEIATGKWVITPYSRLDLVRGKLSGYTEETGSLWDLRFLDQDVDFTSIGLGTIIAYEHRFKRGAFLPRLRAEYLYDLERDADAGVAYRDLVNGPFSTVTLTGFAREQFTFGFGTELLLGSMAFELDYLNRMASGAGSDQTIQIGVSVKY